MSDPKKTPGGPLPAFLTIFDTPNVSSLLWTIAGTMIAVGFVGGIIGLTHRMVFFGLAPIGLIGVGMILAGFGKEIKAANKTQKGVLTIYGGRRNVLLNEGFPLVAPYWPLLVDFEPVDIESVTCKAEWIDVSTMGVSMNGPAAPANPAARTSIGALVRVAVELLVEPDHSAKERGIDKGAERLNTYINRGGMKNATTVILNKIEEAVRAVALRYEWEDFIGLKKPLSALLISLISETKLRRLRLPGQKVPLEANLPFKLEEYDDGAPDEYEDDILAYLEDPAIDKAERKERLKEIDLFLKAAVINGTGDIPSLGVKVLTLNVTAIEATGEAKKAADAASAEKKQRQQESSDFETERQLINAYLDDSRPKGVDGKPLPDSEPTVTYQEAAAWARVNRKRATERIVNVTGTGTDLQKSAAVIAANNEGGN